MHGQVCGRGNRGCPSRTQPRTMSQGFRIYRPYYDSLDADRAKSNKKANDTVHTLQPIGQWAKWECAGADCDNKILPADRPTPSDAMTKVLEKCEEFRKQNPDDTKLYRPMICLRYRIARLPTEIATDNSTG